MLRMASMSSSIDRHNFNCVTRASVDLIKLPLKDILESKIKPEDLYKKIQSCPCLMQGNSKLRSDQLKMCNPLPPAKPDYREFDASLLYTLIRNLCSLPIPKQKWGNEPHPNDTQISDDVERLRLFRNNYYAHAKSSSIPEAVFERAWNDLRDTIDRIQSKIPHTVNYERELSRIERDKSESQNLETYKKILEFYKPFQPENRDEADIYIKGEDNIICGGIARLEAILRGPEPLCLSILWQKQKSQVFEDIDTSNEKYSGSTEKILVIQYVCKEDAGKYQAIIALNESDLKPSAEFCLHVLGEPPCSNQIEVELGDNEITLLCSYTVLDNSPKVHNIEWRRNGQILDQKDKTFSRESVNESIYKITSPTKADIGQYTCTLVNAVGSVSENVLFGKCRLKLQC